MLIETADFNVSTIGDNLPNEQEIHEKYGTKSFVLTGTIRAFNDATGSRSSGEFSATPEERDRAVKYGDLAENLYVCTN